MKRKSTKKPLILLGSKAITEAIAGEQSHYWGAKQLLRSKAIIGEQSHYRGAKPLLGIEPRTSGHSHQYFSTELQLNMHVPVLFMFGTLYLQSTAICFKNINVQIYTL